MFQVMLILFPFPLLSSSTQRSLKMKQVCKKAHFSPINFQLPRIQRKIKLVSMLSGVAIANMSSPSVVNVEFCGL